MNGLTRGPVTLIGVAGAGFLLWLGTQIDTETNGGYWAFVGVTAAAGLAIALSQLLGGWTKWGWPRLSANVFLLGFLPALIAGGWVLLAAQPDANGFSRRASDWAAEIGIGGLIADMTTLLGAIAFGLGLVFGLVFDTTGPRVREVEPERHDEGVAQEPMTAERVEREETAREEFHEPDRETVAAMAERRDRRVQIREGGTPVAPQPDDDYPRRTD